MKLYTWAPENVLPQMAIHGVPEGFPMYGSVVQAAEAVLQHAADSAPAVVLELDSAVLKKEFAIDEEWLDQIAQMAVGDAQEEVGRSLPDDAVQEIYDSVYAQAEEAADIESAVEFADWVVNLEPVRADFVTVLAHPTIEGDVNDPEAELTVSFPGDRVPLPKFKRPMMMQLLRSIFLRRPT